MLIKIYFSKRDFSVLGNVKDALNPPYIPDITIIFNPRKIWLNLRNIGS